jgi:hypothetical protein
VEYPSGVFVETEKGYFYIATSAKRYHVTTKRVLDSWSPPRVVLSSEASCVKYKVAAKLKFRNGSLLQDVSDGKMYFISEGLRRHLTSPEAWAKVGAVDAPRGAKVIRVSQDEINLHKEGLPLT